MAATPGEPVNIQQEG